MDVKPKYNGVDLIRGVMMAGTGSPVGDAAGARRFAAHCDRAAAALDPPLSNLVSAVEGADWKGRSKNRVRNNLNVMRREARETSNKLQEMAEALRAYATKVEARERELEMIEKRVRAAINVIMMNPIYLPFRYLIPDLPEHLSSEWVEAYRRVTYIGSLI